MSLPPRRGRLSHCHPRLSWTWLSSKPLGDTGYTKLELAKDIFELLTKSIGVKDKVHVVGHDIDGIIAHAFTIQFPEHVASIIFGECPLPGSTLFDKQGIPERCGISISSRTIRKSLLL
jgi:pimeloyl-ACP methyl ester carboxylesterase